MSRLVHLSPRWTPVGLCLCIGSDRVALSSLLLKKSGELGGTSPWSVLSGIARWAKASPSLASALAMPHPRPEAVIGSVYRGGCGSSQESVPSLLTLVSLR